MQEAALRASSAVGYDTEKYEALGHFWLIRESQLEILAPLRLGDRVRVKTWVQDFRRVRSRRRYSFSLSSGLKIAEARTDWVYLDRDTLRPAVIPEPMLAAFLPEWAEQDRTGRDPFPRINPSGSASTYTRTVEPRDIDSAGHVNNACYLDFIESGLHQMRRAQQTAELDASNRRIQGFRIEYLQQAMPDETLEIQSWPLDPAMEPGRSYHEIRRAQDGERLTRALIDLNLEAP
jgi:acyl-CoA thioester hydrolase